MKRNRITTAILLAVLLAVCRPAMAMDRWSALSMLESGDNDTAIGRAGEVSRFQIEPMLWTNVCSSPTGAWTNPAVAIHVAQAIMRERCAKFQNQFRRPPTNFEFYVLWNASAQVGRPSYAVSERADRFCNLVACP